MGNVKLPHEKLSTKLMGFAENLRCYYYCFHLILIIVSELSATTFSTNCNSDLHESHFEVSLSFCLFLFRFVFPALNFSQIALVTFTISLFPPNLLL